MLFLIALNGFISVSLGAFGAHGLKKILSSTQLDWWETATLYLMVHTLAALGTWGLSYIKSLPIHPGKLKWSTRMFLVGNIIFSGSLYTMALTNFKVLGMITPLGGFSYLVAWTLLGLSSKNQESQQ